MTLSDTIVEPFDTLPEVFADLPDASWLFDNLIDVSGELSVEICSGDGVFTLGLLMARVPCLKPWDARFGDQFDVLSHGQILIALVRKGILICVHAAPPCQSLSWGRSPPLRSWDHPLGNLALTDQQLALVCVANDIADFIADLCLELYATGGYFSIENPRLSWLWALYKYL